MTLGIGLTLGVLAIAVLLFVTEWLRADVIAVVVALALPWLGLIRPEDALAGLSSNAVVSMLAVMMMGYGLDRSGVTDWIVRPIMRVAANSERRTVALVSVAAGLLSAFMQNIGATVLFIPAVLHISRKSRLPASRLLMPLGFAAILGGTVSMVGSGPLIILNDLMRQSDQPAFGLFTVTPLGLSLLACGIIYFLVAGRIVLPKRQAPADDVNHQRDLVDAWQLPTTIHVFRIPAESGLVGRTREEARVMSDYGLNLLAVASGREVEYAPWRQTRFVAGQRIALLGDENAAVRFARENDLAPSDQDRKLSVLRSSEQSGFAEVLVPPRSPVVGRNLREIALRKNWMVEPILLATRGREFRDDFSDHPIEVGDTLVVHGRWNSIRDMADRRNFVLVTDTPSSPRGSGRPALALLCFVAAVGLAIAGFRLSLALLSGAIGMVLLRVVSIDEAYSAVDWRTIFLIAGLIPLGIAMERTGAAAFVAGGMMNMLGNAPPLLIFAAVGLLATLFSLFMSNVAATVLLVPLVMVIGAEAGIAPRALALLVGVSASNSFVLPTHQVNALLMPRGGYRNADYMRAGSVMSVLFLVVAVAVVYLFYR
ncbi:SLC13 family permease [candidate division WOR-3 bacterium]|nr:SLC13 family permease [candidate division WOR-3 bacterium]